MKKLLVVILAVGFMSGPALASNGGGKKKAKKSKATVECKMNKTCDLSKCDPKDCDPKNCDFSKCDPKNCDLKTCEEKSTTCAPTASCSMSKQ